MYRGVSDSYFIVLVLSEMLNYTYITFSTEHIISPRCSIIYLIT